MENLLLQMADGISRRIIIQSVPLLRFVHSISAIGPRWVPPPVIDDSQAVLHRVPALARSGCDLLERSNAPLVKNMYVLLTIMPWNQERESRKGRHEKKPLISYNSPFSIPDIFRPSIKRFGKFGAVIVTYLVSSLLHGLNFQLAAVLLSLGLYTYVEFQLRASLADTFDACIASKQCANKQKCTHKYKSYNCWWVFMTNLAFAGLAMFHLAYLGLMFDTSDLQETGYSYSHTVDKWARLGFASHWIVLATYCIYFLIK